MAPGVLEGANWLHSDEFIPSINAHNNPESHVINTLCIALTKSHCNRLI